MTIETATRTVLITLFETKRNRHHGYNMAVATNLFIMPCSSNQILIKHADGPQDAVNWVLNLFWKWLEMVSACWWPRYTQGPFFIGNIQYFMVGSSMASPWYVVSWINSNPARELNLGIGLESCSLVIQCRYFHKNAPSFSNLKVF